MIHYRAEKMKTAAKSLWLLFAQAFTVLAAAGLAAAVFLPRGASPDSYRAAVARALPSVVSVYRRGEGARGGGDSSGAGAGVIVRGDGRILTSYHLVAAAEAVEVGLPDGARHSANVLGVDPEIDLAVLQINAASELAALPFAEDSALRAGDVVFAIGNPFGLRRTATMGIVSDVGRRGLGLHQVERFIQTDAAFNPGSSGGPLVNARGELVGINSAVFSRRREGGGSAHGIGFAVPAGLALAAQERLLAEETGGVQESEGEEREEGVEGAGGAEMFGVRIRKLPPRLREEIYGAVSSGDSPVVGRVRPGSEAEGVGFRAGDVLLAVDGAAVSGEEDLPLLSGAREFSVLRGRGRMVLRVDLD